MLQPRESAACSGSSKRRRRSAGGVGTASNLGRGEHALVLEADDEILGVGAIDDGECAQVLTTWVLIEQATGRPRRVPEWITEMFR